jgi:hypothetical protein
MPCYHGPLSREGAEKLVTSHGGDCFLLRSSSVRGCYAMTVYIKEEDEITHYLIYPRTAGNIIVLEYGRYLINII